MIAICQKAFKCRKIMCNGCSHMDPHNFDGDCVGNDDCPDCVRYTPLKDAKHHCIYTNSIQAGRCVPDPSIVSCEGCDCWVEMDTLENCNLERAL